MPRRRRMILMRHGEVSYFDPERPPLDHRDVALSAEGRRQAQAAGRLVAELPLDRVVTSPLRRTQETAELVLGERRVPRHEAPALEEIRPGSVLGLPPEQIQSAMLEAFTGPLTRERPFLAGETFGSLLDRVLPWLDAFVADDTWQHALVVAHGGVNRALLTAVLGSGLAGFGRIEQDPACLNVIDFDEAGRGLVRLVNLTAYNLVHEGVFETTMERLFAEYQRFLGG